VSSSGKGTILMVDDEPLVRRALSRMLQSLGFSVVEEEDGQAALEWLTNNPLGAVLAIVDMSMPGLSGAEVLSQITQLAPELPVVISSGRDREEVFDQLRAHPPAGFLPKPYRLSELEAVLLQALAGETSES